MDRERYLADLRLALGRLAAPQVDAIVAQHESYFRIATQRGMSDAAVIEGLGRPRAVAAGYLAEQAVRGLDASDGPVSTMLLGFGRGFAALIGLGFVNLLFVAGPALGVFCAVILLWGMALAPFLVAGLIVAAVVKAFGIAAFTTLVALGWLIAALGCVLAGCALVLMLSAFTRGLLTLAARYLRINAAMVIGRPVTT